MAFADVVQIKETKERQLTELLRHHDQVFHSLQKLAPPRGAVAASEMGSDLKSLQLVKILVKLTCEEMHCRLDRIYLEQLHRPLGQEYGVEECPSDQEVSLKSDLDSLYAEIRDVVAMSLAQEFELPLIKSQQDDRRHQRGGSGEPNYRPDGVDDALALLRRAGLPERVVIDVSHDNSGKDPRRQPVVAEDVCSQVAAGNGAIVGVMAESFLVGGQQRLGSPEDLVYGQSITDGCIDWEATVEVLDRLAGAVRERRAVR